MAAWVFFVCGAILHIFLAAYDSDHRAAVTVTDHVQVVALGLFLLWLGRDMAAARSRIVAMLEAVDGELGETIGRRVRAIIAAGD